MRPVRITKTAMTTELADRKGALPGTLSIRKIRMRLTLALLLMTTTFGTGSAVFAAGQGRPLLPETNIVSHAAPDAALIQIDDDGDEGEDGWFWSLSDDDDDDCEEDDDEGEETGCAAGATGNAAKAGTVAPPQNGLFTNGTAPVVKSN